jgi:hypothetical protein
MSFRLEFASGKLRFVISDETGDFGVIETDATYNDGSSHRVYFETDGVDETGMDIWVDGTDVATTVVSTGSFSGFRDFDDAVYFFARNNDGSTDRYYDGILDDVCVFDAELTQTQIQSYNEPWA